MSPNEAFDAGVRQEICRHIGISEETFFTLAFEIYSFQGAEYRDELPQYLQNDAHKVLRASTAFRNWFNVQKAENDCHILKFIAQFPPAVFLSKNQYVEMQKFYFEERKVYLDKAVVELAVKAWKERVEMV